MDSFISQSWTIPPYNKDSYQSEADNFKPSRCFALFLYFWDLTQLCKTNLTHSHSIVSQVDFWLCSDMIKSRLETKNTYTSILISVKSECGYPTFSSSLILLSSSSDFVLFEPEAWKLDSTTTLGVHVSEINIFRFVPLFVFHKNGKVIGDRT